MVGIIELPPVRQKWRTKARDEYLKENRGIDPAILADALAVSESFVKRYQRKLGIRPLTGNPPATQRWGARRATFKLTVRPLQPSLR